MDADFRGYVLGLRAQAVHEALRTEGVDADTKRWSPLAAIALGVPRSKLMRGPRAPRAEILYGRLALLGAWSAFTVVVLFTLASFAYEPWMRYRDAAIVAALAFAAATLLVTVFVVQVLGKREGAPAEDALVPTDFPWDAFLLGPDIALIVLLFVLVFLLGLFLVFVVWVPLLFLVLNLLTVGELWRMFRTTYVEADPDDVKGLRRVGGALLRRGAVLSHSWDLYLDPADVLPAIEGRKRLLRVHRGLSLLAALSLLLAITYVASRYLPLDAWTTVLVVEAAATVGSFAYLLVVLVRSRALRRPVRPGA